MSKLLFFLRGGDGDVGFIWIYHIYIAHLVEIPKLCSTNVEYSRQGFDVLCER